MKNVEKETTRHTLRLLKLLSKETKTGLVFEVCEEAFHLKLSERVYRFSKDLVLRLEHKKLIVKAQEYLKLTDKGVSILMSSLNPDTMIASPNIANSKIIIDGHNHQVSINTNESPLMRLFTRKTKNGGTYLTLEEFQAGEQLRKDFERGQLQPKISANLSGAVGSSGRSGFGDSSDISDFALDARKRVSKASEVLGPELSGATVDICCFLKGLENVERERRWPPRSAKLMLKTALSLLARHYGFSGYQNNNSGRSRSWGATGYRPSM